LILAFERYYNINNIKFEGNIHCIAHVLNLVVQIILKTIIKDDYNTDTNDIYNTENNPDLDDDIPSKFKSLIYFKLNN
jgi:hypothetical protein